MPVQHAAAEGSVRGSKMCGALLKIQRALKLFRFFQFRRYILVNVLINLLFGFFLYYFFALLKSVTNSRIIFKLQLFIYLTSKQSIKRRPGYL